MLTIKRIALLAIVVSYLLIVFGGFVASSESGMGCGPEWPLCNGAVIPELQGDTLIEFAHRVIALVVIGIAAVLFVKIKQTQDLALQRAGSWMVHLLGILVVAGAFVVVYDLPPLVVTTHLMLAMIFLGSLLWIYRADEAPHMTKSLTARTRKRVIFHVNSLIMLVLLTFAIGGFIKHQSYGLACGWLDCGTGILPATWPQFLQTLHRGLAVVTTLYSLYLVYLAFAKKWNRGLQTRFLFGALTVLLQLVSGVLTVVTYIPISWTVVHLAIGTLLFAIFADTRAILGIASSSILPRQKGNDARTYETNMMT